MVVSMKTTAQLMNMQKSEVRSDQEVLILQTFDGSETQTRALLQPFGAPFMRSHFVPWEFVVFDRYSERSKS